MTQVGKAVTALSEGSRRDFSHLLHRTGSWFVFHWTQYPLKYLESALHDGIGQSAGVMFTKVCLKPPSFSVPSVCISQYLAGRAYN